MVPEEDSKICRNSTNVSKQIIKLVPPDGGWGYFIMASVIIYTLISSAQLDSFGLIYGDFLQQVTGDKAYGITLTFGILLSCQSYSGLLAHILFHLISYRKVGFIGAVLYFVGSLISVFMNDLILMIICVSFLQAVGLSLMTHSIFSSFYSYFKKKANVVMGICSTVSMVGVFSTPYLAELTIRRLGFRNSLWIMTMLAAILFVAVGVLHPVEWHLKELEIEDVEFRQSPNKEGGIKNQDTGSLPQERETIYTFLETEAYELGSVKDHANSKRIINVLSRWCSKLIEVSLLKSYVYWSVVVGQSCYFICDMGFLALLPAILDDIGIATRDIAVMMTVHFAFDVAARVCYSLLNLIFKTKNRYIFFIGAVITVILRIVFSIDNSYNWRIGTLGILGFVRGWMQVTMTLLVAEEFGELFSSAYSILFVIGGTLNLFMGSISGYVKHITKDNIYIIHTQTSAIFIFIVLSWSVEFLYKLNVISICRNASGKLQVNQKVAAKPYNAAPEIVMP